MANKDWKTLAVRLERPDIDTETQDGRDTLIGIWYRKMTRNGVWQFCAVDGSAWYTPNAGTWDTVDANLGSLPAAMIHLLAVDPVPSIARTAPIITGTLKSSGPATVTTANIYDDPDEKKS